MKAILFLTVLLLLQIGAVIFFNEPQAVGQEPVRPHLANNEALFDSALTRIEKKVEKVEHAPAATRVIIKYKTRFVHVYEPVTSAILVTDSAVYTVPAKVYQGVAVIDGGDLQEQLTGEDTATIDAPVYVDTLIEEANHHISAWQRVKEFITKPFRREKSK